MTNINKKKIEVKKSGVNPVMAAVAGAVAAGVAVAGAMIMSDKKNQAKVKGIVTDIKNKAENKKAEVEGLVNEGKDKVKKLEVIAKDAIDEVKNI